MDLFVDLLIDGALVVVFTARDKRNRQCCCREYQSRIAMGLALVGIALVEILTTFAGDFITSPLLDAIVNLVGSLSPAIVSTLALGLLYRLSTRCRPQWRDVWAGTVIAALALAVLAWGYGLYVCAFGSSSAAGAAGTIVLGIVPRRELADGLDRTECRAAGRDSEVGVDFVAVLSNQSIDRFVDGCVREHGGVWRGGGNLGITRGAGPGVVPARRSRQRHHDKNPCRPSQQVPQAHPISTEQPGARA